MKTRTAVKRTSLVLILLALGWNAPGIAASPDQDEATIKTFIARQAKKEHGEEYPDARKVMTGDLTHDGVAETVVLYTIEGQDGSNNYVQYLAVFARGKNGLVAVTHTEVGGKTARAVELTAVEDNAIQLTTLGYGPEDPACCPSVKGTTRYQLMGKKLREQQAAPRARHN